MSVIAHRPRERALGEPSARIAMLRAFLTIVLVTAVVAAALGGATYVVAQVFMGMLSG
jgi:hypothetical protein